MGAEESIKDDEYGFARYSTSTTTNTSPEESPTYIGYGRPGPDHRRFAIALSELPALNFYNPLLNNPSSSEYIASVRSSMRSIDEIVSAHNMHPRLVDPRDSVGSAHLAASAARFWGQNSVKSIGSSHASETKNNSMLYSSGGYNCGLGKTFWGFFIAIWSVLLMGAAVTAILYFIGTGVTLLQFTHAPSVANVIYGEFHVLNRTIPFEPFGENSTQPVISTAYKLQRMMDHIFQSSALFSALYNRSAVHGIDSSINSSMPVTKFQFQIHLNQADVMIAEKMAHVLMSHFHQREADNRTRDKWTVNLTAIKFAEIVPEYRNDHISPRKLASWGLWSEWTPECYLTSCDSSRTQWRSRRCLLREKDSDDTREESTAFRPLTITPCIAGSTVSAADIEIRPCSCIARSKPPRPRIPFSVVRPTKSTHFRFSNTSIAAFEKLCSECRKGEVCVARLEEVVPVCRWAPDLEDPSGCGGFCRANTEYCLRLGSSSFKCEGLSECLSDIEWRCNDGFCIHNSKRCDKDYNCFDHSDELDCETSH